MKKPDDAKYSLLQYNLSSMRQRYALMKLTYSDNLGKQRSVSSSLGLKIFPQMCKTQREQREKMFKKSVALEQKRRHKSAARQRIANIKAEIAKAEV